MMTKKNEGNEWLLLAFLIPYVISTVLLFFVTIQSNYNLLILIEQIQSTLNINTNKFNLFIGILVILINLLIIFVTFIIIKFITQVILKENFVRDKKLLVTLLLSSSLSSMIALFLQELLLIDFKVLTSITSIVELLIFITLYKQNISDKREVVIVSIAKLMLLITNFIFIWYI